MWNVFWKQTAYSKPSVTMKANDLYLQMCSLAIKYGQKMF